MTPDPNELKAAFENYHCRNAIHFMLWAFQMLAQREPEALRDALKDVFSSEAVEGMAKRAFNIATEAQKASSAAATDTRILLHAIQKQLEDAETYIDQLRREVELLRNELRRRVG